MKKLSILFLLLTTVVMLTSCTELPRQVTPQLLYFYYVPVEVDVIPSTQNALAATTLPVVVIKAEVNSPPSSTLPRDTTNLPGFTITSYKATFAYQNTSMAGAQLPDYSTNTNINVQGNETISIPINFFEDRQRSTALGVFIANNVSTSFGTTVTVTFKGHDSAGNAISLIGSFVALFGEFSN